jgi:hypothetical protein
VEGVADEVGDEVDEENGKLKSKKYEHSGSAGAPCVHGAGGDEACVEDKEECHEANEADVDLGGGERLFLEKLDAVLREPVERLDEKEGCDEGEEVVVELFAEYRHSETALDDSVAGTQVKTLDLTEAERAEEDGLDEAPEEEKGDENHVADSEDCKLGCGEVDDGAVEEAFVVHGMGDDGRGQGERGQDVAAE